jgi:site-specific DNA recombinase
MIDQLKPTIKGIVATESDRLSCDLFQFGWLTTHLSMRGVEIILINECKAESPSEKAFAKIRSVFAEFETELRQARIKRGIQLAKEKGRFMNRPPLGYRMENKRIVIDEKNKLVVIEIFQLAGQGNSLRSISHKTGIKRSTIGNILQNPFYMEDTLHGRHDLFLEPLLWQQKRALKEGNRFQWHVPFIFQSL